MKPAIDGATPRHRAEERHHRQQHVAALEHAEPAAAALARADEAASLGVRGLAQHDEQQRADDEAGNRHDPEHPTPRRNGFEELSRDDGPEAEAEQRKTALLHALIETAAWGPRGRSDGREARRAVSPLHDAHERPDRNEAREAGREPREPRKQQDSRDQQAGAADEERVIAAVPCVLSVGHDDREGARKHGRAADMTEFRVQPDETPTREVNGLAMTAAVFS